MYGIESYVLSPEETKKLYPLMNVDDLYGTLYSPGDGTIDPAGCAGALSRAAQLRGAKVCKDTFSIQILKFGRMILTRCALGYFYHSWIQSDGF